MLSSQMYKEAGIAGLLRASATAPVTAASPLCVLCSCCSKLAVQNLFLASYNVWRAVGAQCWLKLLVCSTSASVLQCEAARAVRRPLRTGTSAACHKCHSRLCLFCSDYIHVFDAPLRCVLVSRWTLALFVWWIEMVLKVMEAQPG